MSLVSLYQNDTFVDIQQWKVLSFISKFGLQMRVVLILGQAAGQIYTYPTKRWKKKKGPPPPSVEEKTKDVDTLGGNLIWPAVCFNNWYWHFSITKMFSIVNPYLFDWCWEGIFAIVIRQILLVDLLIIDINIAAII